MARRRDPSHPPEVSPLEAHLGYWLRFVSNHVSHAFSVKLAARDVTVAEWVILRELYERESVAPSKLAGDLAMTRGAISKLVDRLSSKDLVSRAQGEGDRRYQAVALTAAGRALVPVLAALADENDAAFFGHLSPDERAHIEGVLREIIRRRGLTTVPVD
ncbi:Transcriptional regulator, MarR family protein [Minicystis rosea]|nr:Transcriptional regulator, MarR family protein [Minicystis rosea]